MPDVRPFLLLLEDDPDDAALIRARIGRDLPTYTVQHVADEEAFRAALQRHPFDLVLADYNLPGYDGFQALQAVQALQPLTPLIIISGYLGEETAVAAMRQGASDLVSKDRLDRLAAAIEQATREARLRRAKAEAQGALERSNARLQRANRDLARLAFHSTHELQEPLRNARLFAQLLQDRLGPDADESLQVCLTHILQSTASMRDVVDGMFAYLDLRGRPPQPTAVDLGELVIALLAARQAVLAPFPKAVTYDALPTVWVDRAQWSVLLGELLDNAIKFCGDAPPRLAIRTTADEDGCWQLTVEDHGTGFPPKAEAMLDLFTRQPQHRGLPGCGVGLALCQAIAENHQGRITLMSSSGGGAIVTVTWPQDIAPSGTEVPGTASHRFS